MQERMKLVGQAIPRVDGREKVTGRVVYAGDDATPGMVHAVLVQATIARGTIREVEAKAAAAVPGVVAVYTHETLPRLKAPPKRFTDNFPAERRAPLSDNVVHYAGQHVGIVLAETLEIAQAAAALVRVQYEVETPVLELEEGLKGTYQPDHFATNEEEKLQSSRGRAGEAVAMVEAEYRTPVVHHNPIEPSATLAVWDGDRLWLHDSTRWVQGTRKIVAAMLGVAEDKVRVKAPFVGGAFGSKGFLWQHVALAAQAARTCGRPVKLVLTRPQMFTSTGHRPRTVQRVVLGTDATRALTTVEHRTLTETSTVGKFAEPAGMTSRNLYTTPHAVIAHAVAPTNLATPCFMRAPGESSGMFALESAMDEMAEKAGMDPLLFRLRNYAESDLQDDRPWSSKQLRQCYAQGAERFGWAGRPMQPRSMLRGDKLVGWGMATAAYPARRSPATVRGVLTREGVATFSTATEENGAGTATAMEQIAADALGLPIGQVRFAWGDSAMMEAPVVGASQTASTIGPAVEVAAKKLREALFALAVTTAGSVFYRCDPAELQLDGEAIVHARDGRRETLAAVLAGMAGDAMAVEGSTQLDKAAKKEYTFHSFGVHFAEVEVDRAIGEVRVTRWVSVMDCGRVLNGRLARSQVEGGVIFGIGMALLEKTVYDGRLGSPVNANLAEYHLPTCADVPVFDVSFVEVPDLLFTPPLGHRGVGEIGITGVAGAVANAVWHATGVRVRELPITGDKVMERG